MTTASTQNPFERIIGLMVSQVRESALALYIGGLALLSILFVYSVASAYAGVLIRGGWLVVTSSSALISVGHCMLVRYRFDRKIEACARECHQWLILQPPPADDEMDSYPIRLAKAITTAREAVVRDLGLTGPLPLRFSFRVYNEVVAAEVDAPAVRPS